MASSKVGVRRGWRHEQGHGSSAWQRVGDRCMEQKAIPGTAVMGSVVSPACRHSALGCTRQQEWLHCGTLAGAVAT